MRTRPKRRQLFFNLAVYDSDTGKLLGRLVDITTSGLMLMSNDPLEVGHNFNLSLDVTEANIPSLEDRISLYVVTKWCKQSVNPNLYDTGCEFIDPSTKTIESIAEIIDRIAFSESS